MSQVTIGQLATAALKSGKSGKEALSMVKRVFPNSKTTMKGIRSYASEAGVRLRPETVINQDELKKVLSELNGNGKAIQGAKQ